MKFDYKKPTVQMLGRFQPVHSSHVALFERAFAKTGQVCIMIRDVEGVGDNPFDFEYRSIVNLLKLWKPKVMFMSKILLLFLYQIL
jgi:nicotinamide mononucleotide adenylyltransferase